MNKFKKMVSAVVDASSRPAEGWRFLRQAVRELHVVLQGITSIVGDFEERLDRLETAAMRRPTSTSSPSTPAARKPRKAVRKSASTKKAAAKKTRRAS